MDWLLSPESLIALATLTVLELVLGIDNIIFITIQAGKLPESQRARARNIGLALAMIMRIALLLSIAWIARLTAPLFAILGMEISGRDLIMLAGGLFLLAKATFEIHDKLEGNSHGGRELAAPGFASVITQIVLLDIVFSLDSVITAVGLVDELGVMVTAIVVAVLLMMLFARAIGNFVERHPTVKMLALAFLFLIGMALVADGLDQHIPRGYIYFAMGFSVFVELLNMRARKAKSDPVTLRGSPK